MAEQRNIQLARPTTLGDLLMSSFRGTGEVAQAGGGIPLQDYLFRLAGPKTMDAINVRRTSTPVTTIVAPSPAGLLSDEMLSTQAPDGFSGVAPAPPTVEMTSPEFIPAPMPRPEYAPTSDGLLGTIGGAISRGVGLLGESLREPLAAGISDIPEAMQAYELMRSQGPMMALDPAELSSVTPASAIAMLPQIRAKREAEAAKLKAELQKTAPKEDGKVDERSRRKAFGVVSSIDDALSILQEHGNFAAGFGSVMKYIPTTPANLLDKSLDTIKAQIGFAELQAMRDASKTGGALGQVTERELQLLQRTIAAIEPDLSATDLRRNLNKVREVMLAIAHGTQDPRTGEIKSIVDDGFNISPQIKTYNPETDEIE